MSSQSAKRRQQVKSKATDPAAEALWKLQDAKARFSAVVRAAREGKPQRITVHGKDAVVVLAAETYDRLVGRNEAPNLFELLSKSPLRDLEFERPGERSPVREVEL